VRPRELLKEAVIVEELHAAPVRELGNEKLRELQQRQIRAVTYLDGVFERLFDMVPENTWVVVTADHGELFGEEGYFGHGPIAHNKAFEVPFVEARIR